jgi:hypothetical protein
MLLTQHVKTENEMGLFKTALIGAAVYDTVKYFQAGCFW